MSLIGSGARGTRVIRSVFSVAASAFFLLLRRPSSRSPSLLPRLTSGDTKLNAVSLVTPLADVSPTVPLAVDISSGGGVIGTLSASATRL
jgi:hypothetical protein